MFTGDLHLSVILFATVILIVQLLAAINVYNFFLFANRVARDAKLPAQKIIILIDAQPD